jgi:hypothetical protein
MSWFFGPSEISVDEAKKQIYAKVKDLAPTVQGYKEKGKKDDLRWLADQIGLRIEGASPAVSPQPAASVTTASGGRRRRTRKTRNLRR